MGALLLAASLGANRAPPRSLPETWEEAETSLWHSHSCHELRVFSCSLPRWWPRGRANEQGCGSQHSAHAVLVACPHVLQGKGCELPGGTRRQGRGWVGKAALCPKPLGIAGEVCRLVLDSLGPGLMGPGKESVWAFMPGGMSLAALGRRKETSSPQPPGPVMEQALLWPGSGPWGSCWWGGNDTPRS